MWLRHCHAVRPGFRSQHHVCAAPLATCLREYAVYAKPACAEGSAMGWNAVKGALSEEKDVVRYCGFAQ